MTRLKRLLAELIESNRELTAALDPSIMEKARKYDELVRSASLVKAQVRNVSMVIDDGTGRIGAKVSYDMPSTTIWLDAGGKTESPDEFRAMNDMGMLSPEDCDRIRRRIGEILRECKQG